MTDAISREPIRPDRIRRVRPGFSVIQTRFLHGGFLESLTDDERVLYLFLLLAGDRNGMSYYSVERTSQILRHSAQRILDARSRLIRRDLLASDGVRSQILELPDHPMALTPRPTTPRSD